MTGLLGENSFVGGAKTPSLPAVERTLLVLEEIARSEGGLSLAQLGSKLRVPRSSLYCLLVTLERSGHLRRLPAGGRFVLGPRLFTFASAALTSRALMPQVAAPLMRSLAQRVGLTSHLALLDHDQVVLVAQQSPGPPDLLATWRGQRLDCHCTALGKALIAYLPAETLARITGAHGLPRHNENTIVSISKLRSQLAEIRRRGYSVDDEEDELGTRCLGAPVFDASGAVVAAISIAGTVDQFCGERLSGYAGKLIRAASEISATLKPVRVPEQIV